MTIFVSYAHHDRPHVDDFLHQLGVLKAADATIRPVSDRDIPAGANWAEWIAKNLGSAEGGILLVSAAFFKSKWCEKEAMALYDRLEPTRILPVLLGPCAWETVGWLSRYQLVNETPVVVEGAGSDERWSEIVNEIWEARKNWSTRGGGVYPPPPPERDPMGVGMETLVKALSSGGGGAAFFLGPGIHGVQSKTAAANHIRARFDLLAEELMDETVLGYARSVVEEKLPGALDRAEAAPTPAEEWRRDLVGFQVSLARLGGFASRLIAKRMYEDRTALANISSLVISLEQDGESPEQIEERTELRNLFLEACQKVCVLWDAPSLSKVSCDIGLGVQGILEQMMALTYVAVGRDLESSQDKECQAWHRLFQSRLYSEARRKITQLRLGKGQRFLALAHLEWLGDLLWHTLRFDTPIYPSPGDLAFQLSVCASPFTPPRREKIGTIASLALPALVDKVKMWLEKSSAEDQHEIYHAVARALCDAWNKQKRGPTSFARSAPLAVTTNFDNELELILHRARISHHILFPVHCRRKSIQDHGMPIPPEERQEWMLYTEAWSEEEEYPVPSWLVLGRDELEVLDFAGPLLVKLYGSPLTKVRQEFVRVDGQENKSLRFEFSHRLIISDLDLLAVMVQDWWPVGLANLLFGEPDRLICFLGYSPEDVDNRLRLFEHVRHYELSRTDETLSPDLGAVDRGVPIVVMSPPEDPIYSKYLTQLQTRVLLEDLDKICMVIRKYCECEAIDKVRSAK